MLLSSRHMDAFGWMPEEIDEQTADQSPLEPASDASRHQAPGHTRRAPTSYVPVADAESPNYRHLGSGPLAESFELSADHLMDLCALNDFAVDDTACILFGLRGCAIVQGEDGRMHPKLILREAAINHVDCRCVLGVWRPASGTLAAFTGSTVPNLACVQASVQGGRNANMLPTGSYGFFVGQHKYVEGAFREAGDRVVVRARRGVRYTTSDAFVAANPGDNIHPTFYYDNTRFSSAGCQTVRGTVSRMTPQVHHDHHDGPGWKTFRALAGLSDPPSHHDDGRRFRYVLLTGREAGLVALHGRVESLRRLRFGSKGSRVKAMQKELRLNDDGDFGKDTALAWITHQQAISGTADGIVTPNDFD